MANKVEAAPSGRASCRGCKRTIAKGELRFAEEAANPYSEEGGLSFRYWHLACAATKQANELAAALASYEGPAIEGRAELDAVIAEHIRPPMPHAERASSGRARCRTCDQGIPKGALRVAFERVYEGPMGAQKVAVYVHPGCIARFLARETESGRTPPDAAELLRTLRANSKLADEDMRQVEAEASRPDA